VRFLLLSTSFIFLLYICIFYFSDDLLLDYEKQLKRDEQIRTFDKEIKEEEERALKLQYASPFTPSPHSTITVFSVLYFPAIFIFRSMTDSDFYF